MLSDVERKRIIRARIGTSTRKGLRQMRSKLVNKLRWGWVSQELYDFIVVEIDKRLGELGCSA